MRQKNKQIQTDKKCFLFLSKAKLKWIVKYLHFEFKHFDNRDTNIIINNAYIDC